MNSVPTCLYRHFSGDDTLLYVGISLNILNRTYQHRRCSGWFDEIKRIDVEWFPSRQEAIDAEDQAIKGESPQHNKKGMLPAVRRRAAEESALELTSRIVNFHAMYTLGEVGGVINASAAAVRGYIERGTLGTVTVLKKTRTHTLVTGWQLIDFLEFLESEGT